MGRKFWAVVVLTLGLAPAARADSIVDCYTHPSGNCFETKPAAMPASEEEYRTLRDSIGKDPYGGVVLLMQAVILRLTNKDLGEQLATMAVTETMVEKAGEKYKITGKARGWIDRTGTQAACMRSYVAGTSPENGYTIPDLKSMAFRFRKQTNYVGTEESGDFKVFLCSTGTDSCRPIRLLRNKNGIWKAVEFSSLATGCRPPKTGPKKEHNDAADAL